MNNDLISRKWLTDAIRNRRTYLSYEDAKDVIDLIDNAPTVDEIPQGEWVRKEDIIRYIATQYSEHNELVPVWLNIGDLKGGAE